MSFTRPNLTQIFIVLILLIGIGIRIKVYGDPRLSIASNDTSGYVTSAQAPLTSWEIFTGRRLFTTNILYKAFEPAGGYEILVNGSFDTTRRLIQPDFEYITSFQFILSIFSWSFLALTISKFINSSALKVLTIIIILLFAFTPQIADWDSVLMSESLTFSLFVLQLALLTRILFLEQGASEIKSVLLLISWITVHFFWVFTRDTNLYAIPASIALLTGLWFLSKNIQRRKIIVSIIVLMGIFLLGWYTAGNSIRSTIEIGHVYQSDLLPWPTRVAILQAMGMPLPDSPEFKTWFKEHSVGTFIKFAVSHPGYLLSKLGKDILLAFDETTQTYFKIPELGQWRWITLAIGDILHPRSPTPLLISAVILGVLLYSALKNMTASSRPWAWLAAWLFTIASLTIFISIIAGASGLYRHALFSTMLYRLSMWIFLIIVLDMVLSRNVQQDAQVVIDQSLTVK